MSIVSTTIPNLVNGVSQQPYALRLASQAEEQINGIASVVDGLRKRPGTRHVAKILNYPLGNAFTHTINRDSNERYTVIMTGANIRVFRQDGSEVAVAAPEGWAYAQSGNPQGDFSVVTVADYTFLVNKTRVVEQHAQLTPGRMPEALIWVRQGAYSTNYVVTVNGVQVVFKTPDANSAADGNYVATDHIAGQLQTLLRQHLGGAGFFINQVGSVLHVYHSSNDFSITVSDGVGDQALKVVRGTVQRFSDLPAKAVGGFKCRVRGTNENAFSDYYVEYEADATNPFGGAWKEAAKSNEPNKLRNVTMPHALVREANGTFTFRSLQWDERKVGSVASTPYPSFTGRTISDIFFHRNRLGLLAGENVCFSRSGEFFSFFPSSALQLIDTDPIDVAVSHVKVSNLRHAIPFNESLLLFSDQTQFTVGKSDLLTPRTISINQTTEFECSLRAKPVGAGQNVYFATSRGRFTGIREYYVNGDTEQNDAAEITAHCPRYLPAGVVKLAASSNEDTLVALSENERGNLYVYRYYMNGNDKLQSCWSRWQFGTNAQILNCDFIESDLWLLVARPDGTYLEVMSIEPGRTEANADYAIHLDRKVNWGQCTVSYNASTDRTTVYLPYDQLAPERVAFVAWADDATYVQGQLLQYEQVPVGGMTSYVFKGRLTRFLAGRIFTFQYRFSTLMIREEASGGGGMQPIGEGRIQLRRMALTYHQSAYFRVEVTPSNRDTYRYPFAGRIIGAGENRINRVSIASGLFKFPIMSKNDQVRIDIVNDSPFPCAFLSAEWEAMFQIRSRRL